jgi:hypothetical protein
MNTVIFYQPAAKLLFHYYNSNMYTYIFTYVYVYAYIYKDIYTHTYIHHHRHIQKHNEEIALLADGTLTATPIHINIHIYV